MRKETALRQSFMGALRDIIVLEKQVMGLKATGHNAYTDNYAQDLSEQIKRAHSYLMDLGIEQKERGKFLEAENTFRAAMKMDPAGQSPFKIPNTDVYAHMAVVLLRQGRDEEAGMYLGKVQMYSENDAEGQFNVANCYKAAGRLTEAYRVAMLGKEITLDEETYGNLEAMGMALAKGLLEEPGGMFPEDEDLKYNLRPYNPEIPFEHSFDRE